MSTKKELARKGVLSDSFQTTCIFCNRLEESTLHVFFECDIVLQVWNMMVVWFETKDYVGVGSVTPCMQQVKLWLQGRVNEKFVWLFWLGICWSVWLFRKEVFFKDRKMSANDILALVKDLSWNLLAISSTGKLSLNWEGVDFRSIPITNNIFYNKNFTLTNK